MTDQELLEIESALAQYRSALREVGNTANLQAATEELLVVTGELVAEVRRLNALVEQCKRVFTWKSYDPWEWNLCSCGVIFDKIEMRGLGESRVWDNAFSCCYFDTAEEAREWVENRLRERGVIKPIDVVEVRP